MTEPTYAPKPIKMLEVEDAVKPEPAIEPIAPLDTDTSHIEPPLNEPQQPIGPDEIDKPSTAEEGESGSDPLRASILSSVIGRLRGK